MIMPTAASRVMGSNPTGMEENMRILFAASLVFLMLVPLAPDLGATAIKPLTIHDLTEKAQLIMVGQAIDTKSVWVDRRLVTLATISVGEVLKGDRHATVTVVLPGGVDANRKFPLAMIVPGAPQIHAQEEVFLFLRRANQHPTGDTERYTIVGFSQGKLSIVTDANGSKLLARQPVSAGSAGLVSLAQFKQEISGLVAGDGAHQQP
jgi:hypothetical protein